MILKGSPSPPPLLPESARVRDGKNRTDFVVPYPEERVTIPMPSAACLLVQLDNGQPKCVACGLSSSPVRPTAISIVRASCGLADRALPEAFDIRHVRAACLRALRRGVPGRGDRDEPRVELANLDRELDAYDKEPCSSEALLQRRLGFLRGEYDREQAPEKRG